MVRAFVERNPVHQTLVPHRGYSGHIKFRGAMYETVFGKDPYYFEHVAALMQDPEGQKVGLQIIVEPGEEGVFEQALTLVRDELVTATVVMPSYAEQEQAPSVLPAKDHDAAPVWPEPKPELEDSTVSTDVPPPILDDPLRPAAVRKGRSPQK